MPARKRAAAAVAEPAAKRRSSRQAAAAPAEAGDQKPRAKTDGNSAPKKSPKADTTGKRKDAAAPGPKATKAKPAAKATSKGKANGGDEAKPNSRAVSEDPDVDSIPVTNPDAPRHEGEWYWLMKAEPESRFEHGIDVRFSIDDLRAKDKPEGWDGKSLHFGSVESAADFILGIRAYAGTRHKSVCEA